MEEQRKNSAAAGRDRISELPDEILHRILRHLKSSASAARTTVISRRWRSVWLSYPFVEFEPFDFGYGTYATCLAKLKVFGDEEIKRFSRNSLSRMERLRISVQVDGGTFRSPAIEQLLDLARKKNSEEIDIWVSRTDFYDVPGLRLPMRLLANSSLKILRLGGVVLVELDSLLPLSSLRSLSLTNVTFQHEQTLLDLISSPPLLETLELNGIGYFRKLRLSNLPNLKNLLIIPESQLVEIYISAPALLKLSLLVMENVSKIEVTAPRLKVLEIRSSSMSPDKIDSMVSSFQSLQSLTLDEDYGSERKKLKLASPNLEEFELHASPRLEEIELDSGSCLTNLLLYCHRFSPDKLKKCEIRNPSSTCRWEADFSMNFYEHDADTHPWFVGFERFLTSFTQFQTIRVSCDKRVRFRNKEVDLVRPHAIKHLMIETSNCLSSTNQSALLDGLFWACRPRFLSIFHKAFLQFQGPQRKAKRTARDSACSKLLFQVFLSQHSSEASTNRNGLNEHSNWQHQLKDVKIMSGNMDGEFIFFHQWCNIMKKKETLQILEEENKEGKEEAIDVSEHVAAYLKNPNQVCFMLTWC